LTSAHGQKVPSPVWRRAAAANSSAGSPPLVWDTCISAFSGRQALYEYYFFGDPVRMAGAYLAGYGREPYLAAVRAFLDRD
jgi:hypothetical protein